MLVEETDAEGWSSGHNERYCRVCMKGACPNEIVRAEIEKVEGDSLLGVLYPADLRFSSGFAYHIRKPKALRDSRQGR